VVFLAACPEGRGSVQETFELNQLKSGPSQLLPGFFFQNLTGCKLLAINLDWPISYRHLPNRSDVRCKLVGDIGYWPVQINGKKFATGQILEKNR
jgi:hypothetical protein